MSVIVIMTVSYTHLDVYKRQEERSSDAAQVSVVVGVRAVSYTHLDVYKRQGPF